MSLKLRSEVRSNPKGDKMSCVVTPAMVEELHRTWRGNGGRRNLLSLSKGFNLTINELYAILATPFDEAMARAKRGKRFSSL